MLALVRLAIAFALGASGALHGQVTVHKKDGTDKKDYSDVVVYIADENAPVSGAHAEIRQRKEQFAPRVLVVAAGTEVTFPNDDSVEHNVFSHSASADFDLGRFGKGKGKSRAFAQPGFVEIFCNVHKEMVAYLVVAPSKAFALTGADGRFEIGGVTPGKHRVVVWDRLARPRVHETTVEVPAAGAATFNYDLTEMVDGDGPHKNKFGVDYSPGYH